MKFQYYYNEQGGAHITHTTPDSLTFPLILNFLNDSHPELINPFTDVAVQLQALFNLGGLIFQNSKQIFTGNEITDWIRPNAYISMKNRNVSVHLQCLANLLVNEADIPNSDYKKMHS